jgi:WhiB family redox-sensing transcriptional regulator
VSDLPAWWHEPHPCDGNVDIMFAPGARKDGTMAAKAICRTCPHIDECRQHAHAMAEPYGVWGGEGPRTRFAHLNNGIPPRQRRRAIAECGTPTGHRRHIDRKETPCDDCRQAWNAYKRDLRARTMGAA